MGVGVTLGATSVFVADGAGVAVDPGVYVATGVELGAIVGVPVAGICGTGVGIDVGGSGSNFAVGDAVALVVVGCGLAVGVAVAGDCVGGVREGISVGGIVLVAEGEAGVRVGTGGWEVAVAVEEGAMEIAVVGC